MTHMKSIDHTGQISSEIRETSSSNIDFSQPFFDSFKQEYKEFEEWSQKVSSQNRKSFIASYRGQIVAIAILKEECEEIPMCEDMRAGRVLKICTFKVEEYKKILLGELLIKKIFNEALKLDIATIYVTILPNKTDLIDFFEKYGFRKKFSLSNETYNREEDVYVKDVIPPKDCRVDDPVLFNQIFFPSVLTKNVNVYLLPSTPRYHNEFFNNDDKQMRFSEVFEIQVRKNFVIEKKYYSTSKNRKVSKGDILLFCRTTKKPGITSVGIVTDIKHTQEPLSGARSVEGPLKVSSSADGGKPAVRNIAHDKKTEITFRHCFDLENIIDLEKMREIYARANKKDQKSGRDFSIPQSIHPISHAYLQEVIKVGGIDKKYFFDMGEK